MRCKRSDLWCRGNLVTTYWQCIVSFITSVFWSNTAHLWCSRLSTLPMVVPYDVVYFQAGNVNERVSMIRKIKIRQQLNTLPNSQADCPWLTLYRQTKINKCTYPPPPLHCSPPMFYYFLQRKFKSNRFCFSYKVEKFYFWCSLIAKFRLKLS